MHKENLRKQYVYLMSWCLSIQNHSKMFSPRVPPICPLETSHSCGIPDYSAFPKQENAGTMEIPREILIYIYRLIHRYMWIEWSSTTPTTIDFRQKLRLCFKHPQSLLSTAFPRLQGAVTWCFLPWWRRHRDPWPERRNTQRHRGQPYHHLKNWGIRQSKQKEYALYIKYP